LCSRFVFAVHDLRNARPQLAVMIEDGMFADLFERQALELRQGGIDGDGAGFHALEEVF
jgi:hypothetical protein